MKIGGVDPVAAPLAMASLIIAVCTFFASAPPNSKGWLWTGVSLAGIFVIAAAVAMIRSLRHSTARRPATSGTLRRIWTVLLVVVLVAAALLTGIVIDRLWQGSSPTASTQLTPPAATGLAAGPVSPPALSTSSATASPSVPMFVFDDLGAAPPTIEVYPGPADSTVDRTSNGTFRNGDKAPALCATSGRSVTSNTAAGERANRSSTWIRIDGSPGLTQYAPLTYGHVTPSLDALRRC